MSWACAGGAPELGDPPLIRVQMDPDLPAVPCRCEGHEVHHGDACVIELPDGQFVGHVTHYAPPVVCRPKNRAIGRVVRLATERDLHQAEDMAAQERETLTHLRRRVAELGLEIRPIKARFPISGRKAVIYFTAEKRVDFHGLVRELARRYRRRIEMRHMGVRDEAKNVGGLGPCGRELCCGTFMTRFHSVTVRMAKRQNLSLNPTKISGMCGRLMCCLAHEADQYPDPRQKRRKERADTT